jgi:hypothetical protein
LNEGDHLENLGMDGSIINKKRGKFAPVFNYLSTMPWRHMGEWKYKSTFLDLGTRWK